MRLRDLRQPLREQVDLSQVKALYHATHVGNLENIQMMGVVPMHGEIVQGTETYQTVVDEWGEELEEIAFFSPEDPGFVNWQVGNHLGKDMWDVTVDDIRKAGVVTILFPWRHREEIWCADGQGGATRLDGEDRMYEIPGHVEGVDCFSFEPVEPDMILTGDKMITFLEKYFPSALRMAQGELPHSGPKDPGFTPQMSPEDVEIYDAADGNQHDLGWRADYNHWGTHGMGKNGMSKSFSISPGEPGVLLPGEADPTGGDGIPDRMTVRKR